MRPRSPLHRITTWPAIVGYALVASGLPLPLGIVAPAGNPAAAKRFAGKDRSRPFPCMDKPCGCATAEQCFSNCCCHSPAERLAWATSRGVEQAVLAALERRVAADAAEKPGTCCSSKKTAPGCCASKAAAESEQPPPEQQDPPGSRTVVLRAMLACGGIVAQWFAAAGSLPPPVVECLLPFPCIECLAVVDEFDEQPHFSPAAPPPRAAA